MVASFVNRFHLLKSGRKTHACAARILTEHTRHKCCDHAHFHPHIRYRMPCLFLRVPTSSAAVDSPNDPKASSICTLEKTRNQLHTQTSRQGRHGVLTPRPELRHHALGEQARATHRLLVTVVWRIVQEQRVRPILSRSSRRPVRHGFRCAVEQRRRGELVVV